MSGATEMFWEEVIATDIWTPCVPVQTVHMVASPEWQRFLPADLDDVDLPSPEARLTAELAGEAFDAWMKENAD